MAELKALAEAVLTSVQQLPDLPGSLELAEITVGLERICEAGVDSSAEDVAQLAEWIRELGGRLPLNDLRNIQELAGAAAATGVGELEGVGENLSELIKSVEVGQLAGFLLAGIEKLQAAGKEIDFPDMDGLKAMAEAAGQASEEQVEQLRGWIAGVSSSLDAEDLQKLRAAATSAASAGVAGLDGLGEELAETLPKVGEELSNLAAVALNAVQQMQPAARQGVAAVEAGLRAMVLKTMAENPFGEEEVAQLKAWIQELAGKLAAVDLEDVQRAVAQAVSAGAAGLEGLDEVVVEALQKSREELAGVASLLLEGLQKAAAAGAPVAESALEEAGKLVEAGTEMGAEEISKLKEMIEELAGKLLEEDLEELRKAVASSPAVGATLAGAGVALGAVTAAAGAAGAAAGAAADAAVPVLQDIYDNSEVEKIMGEGFATLDETFTMSMDDLRDAMQELQGLGGEACAKVCSIGKMLLRVEIFRDFMQTMGVLMNNLFVGMQGFVSWAVDLWGKVFGFITGDLYALVHTEEFKRITIIVAVVLAIVCIILYFYLWCNLSTSNAMREGHEATAAWRVRAKESKYSTKAIGGILFLCTSAHLPVARTCIEILTCKGDTATSLASLGGFWDCQGTYIKVIAVFLILLFAVPFPVLCIYQIQKNKPRGSLLDANVTYDADGEEVPFDDKRYNERVEGDPDQVVNPWRSLYKGFERRWAWYKVLQMVIKVLLALIAIALVDPMAQAIACTAVLLIFLGMSCFTTPFIESRNDKMDGLGRFCALLSCVCSLLLALAKSDGSDVLGEVIGFVLLVLTTISTLVQLYFVLSSLEPVKRRRDNWLGLLTFKDTVLNKEGLPHKMVPELDICKEIKHRIWHRFWDGVLLHMCGDDVASRNIELKEETQNHGFTKIKMHWDGEGIPKMRATRLHARQELEGVDLFWNGGWAKLWIDDYPFQLFIVPDAGGEVQPIIEFDEVQKFVNEQHSDWVEAGRVVRRRLRAMSMSGATFHWPFSRVESETFADGTQTTTDSEGNSHTTTVYSTVEFEVFYTQCSVSVSTDDSSKLMAAGFKVAANYCDGYGEAHLPRTGRTEHVSGRSCSMPPSHLGISEDCQPCGSSDAMFEASVDVWEPQLPELEANYAAYRQGLIAERTAANEVLSSGFWYYVYNNEHLDLDHLREYLSNNENNKVLVNLVDKQEQGLDFVYKRLAFCRRHTAWGTWWVFWDQVWSHNQHMTKIVALGDELNPDSASSITYRPMPREELEAWLEERGLRGAEGRCPCSKWWLGDKALNALYEKMLEDA